MRTTTGLPDWDTVLAVVAHPDDESFGLGAILSSLAGAGARVHVLCLTRGEASTLHGVEGELSVIRERELRAAADALGARGVTLLDLPDGGLTALGADGLDDAVEREIEAVKPDGLVAFDSTGISGHLDHVAATAAAVRAGERHDLGVLAWVLPDDICATLAGEGYAGFLGRPASEIDLALTVDRAAQLAAVECHPSQAVPGSVLWRRLELQGDTEHLRWLRRP
ncbi:PIG-L family deacetylase [Dietzia kunjamensis]|uniref:PIG-L family deacetylase n=1 Tax=Dietzia kunjamensis TaxID=322509 RepID=UPI002DBD2780|nr:PIG-L deacetylase family protein [Dietzia kunjamensis]MEB8327091.1 PIG-L family deacetylase [Dietzia kunjamensis]